MKIITFYPVIILTLFAGCTNSTSNQNEVKSSSVAMRADGDILDVAQVIEGAEEYHQKEVVLKGTVVHVCKHSGKRLHLMSKDQQTRIRVEAVDIDKFERELEGSEILVKGIFFREVIDEEYLAKWSEEMKGQQKGGNEAHEGEEHKEKESQYRGMMKQSGDGKFTNFWVDGILFEVLEQASEI